MQLPRSLAGAIIAQIVDIDSVDDVRDAPLPGSFIELREQLILTVKTAVAIVLHVIGIIELVGRDVLVAKALDARELLGVGLVRIGERSGIRRDGDGLVAESAMRGPG